MQTRGFLGALGSLAAFFETPFEALGLVCFLTVGAGSCFLGTGCLGVGMLGGWGVGFRCFAGLSSDDVFQETSARSDMKRELD